MPRRALVALPIAAAVLLAACGGESAPEVAPTSSVPTSEATSTVPSDTEAPEGTDAPASTEAPAPAVSVTVPAGVTFPIVRDDKGTAVKIVQEMLLAAGYDTTGIDGEFGENTRIALQAFREDQRILGSSNEVDEALWIALATAEAIAPDCSREALYEALKPSMGEPDFPLDDFKLANAHGCAPGWALGSRYLSGTEGKDNYLQDIFLFRVRGDQWQLIETLERVRTVTNEISKVPQSPLTWYTFGQLFGEKGWPANVNYLRADEVPRFVFKEVFNMRMSDESVNDVVNMWFTSGDGISDGGSLDVYRSWRVDSEDGSIGNLRACQSNTGKGPFTMVNRHYTCDWELPGGVWYTLYVRGDVIALAKLQGPFYMGD